MKIEYPVRISDRRCFWSRRKSQCGGNDSSEYCKVTLRFLVWELCFFERTRRKKGGAENLLGRSDLVELLILRDTVPGDGRDDGEEVNDGNSGHNSNTVTKEGSEGDDNGSREPEESSVEGEELEAGTNGSGGKRGLGGKAQLNGVVDENSGNVPPACKCHGLGISRGIRVLDARHQDGGAGSEMSNNPKGAQSSSGHEGAVCGGHLGIWGFCEGGCTIKL